MVDTRHRNRNPSTDNLRDDPPKRAVGFHHDPDAFHGGVIEDGRRGPPDDEGFAPAYAHYHSGFGALGDRDPNDPELREDRDASGPYRGRGPKGYKRSDERIHEDVCERLTQDRFIDASSMDVTVKDGEVTLNGTVASRGLKFRAEDLAHLASGVKHVQNNLRIESDV